MIDDQKCPPATDLDSHAHLHGEETPVVIHGVHHVFHPPVALAEWPDAAAARASCSLPAASRAKRCSRYDRQAARQLKTVAGDCGNERELTALEKALGLPFPASSARNS
jgi:hypothetical protein